MRRILLLLTVLLYPSVTNGQADTYKTTMVKGVPHINNLRPKWGKTPQIQLTLKEFLGEIETADDNYLLYKPVDIANDNQGNIYVLEQGNKRVQKYDRSGKYLATFCREGQGPGELMRPFALDIDAAGNIYIADFGNSRVQILNKNGAHKNSITITPYIDDVRVLRSGEIVLKNIATENSNRFKPEKGTKPWMPLTHIHDSSGKIIRRFGEGHIYSTDNWKTGLNRTFYCTDKDDNVYVAMIWQNRIEKFSADGTHVFRTNRPINPKEDIEEMWIGSKKMLIDIDVDDKGRIWLLSKKRRLKKNERREADLNNPETDMYILYLYDRDGVLLYVYQMDHFCDGLRCINGDVYIMDARVTSRFYIYKIDEM